VAFNCLLFKLIKIFSDLLSVGAVQTCVRKYSIAIQSLNDFIEENSNGKKSHIIIPIDLDAIQTLTKLLYCSVT